MKGQTNAWLKDIVSGEKISITLTTNQSSHTDLMGAVITVSYAGNLTEYTWNGDAIQTLIPPMMDYTVSYSNVNGYSTPEPFSGKAMDGRVSEVIGTYNTEIVTINVSAEEGEVSGYEIQIISNGNVLYTQTTPSASYKIPYDTLYTIKASDVRGYTTPSEQSFTASQPTRNVDVTYSAAIKGIFIQDIYGNLYTEDEWDGTQTANGIAVLADECEFVVSSNYTSTTNWGNGTLVDGIVTTTTKSEAIKDYSGEYNTEIITASNVSSGFGYMLNNTLLPDGRVGYVGAAGEWSILIENITLVNGLLQLIGGKTIFRSSTYWTSTQYAAGQAWYVRANYDISFNSKKSSSYILPFAPYIANPKIISFTIGRMTYQCLEGTTWGQWCSSAFNNFGWAVKTDNRIGDPNYPNKSEIYDESTYEYVYNTDIIKDGGKYYDYMSEPF